MRRIAVFLLALFLIFTTAVSASAATAASHIGAYATVTADGRCQVTMTVKLKLEQAVPNPTFPVPRQASNVTLNGSRVRCQTRNDALLIDLSGILGNMAGDFTITVGYTISDVISDTKTEQLLLQVPLLSGFAYPVQALDFSVTLPGAPVAKPSFSSGYHQADIEKDLTYSISGATISGSAQKELKDHETLVMSLTVSPDMFPQTGIELPDLQAVDLAMCAAALLAVVYWLLTMRCVPPRRILRPNPPEGYTAGELGSLLTMTGADLTMMVFTWAQLGYLLIHLNRQDRVTLYKRMDMGNERSEFEQRCFKQLFSKSDTVDTSGNRYNGLCLKIKKSAPNTHGFLKRHSGNPRLFRALSAMVGLFGGVSLGISLSTGAALQWFLVCVLAVLGTVSSLYIHRWAYCLFLLDKHNLRVTLIHCSIWLLLGFAAGTPITGLFVVLTQLPAGLMAAYGGRRTESGRQAMTQVLGLRRYLRSADPTQLHTICQNDPYYFHTLLPYALALGVDNAFARRLGKRRLLPCPYLTTGSDSPATAGTLSVLMRRVAGIMHAGQKQRFSEKALSFLRSLVR